MSLSEKEVACQSEQQVQVPDTHAVDLLCLHDSPLVRGLYICGGFFALALGALGAILPILPTTPFVLLAAWCFARGSERFHKKLLDHRIAGPIICEWCLYRSIPRRVKKFAFMLMALSFSISIYIVPEIWQKIMLVTIASILAIYIWRIPVREPVSN